MAFKEEDEQNGEAAGAEPDRRRRVIHGSVGLQQRVGGVGDKDRRNDGANIQQLFKGCEHRRGTARGIGGLELRGVDGR